MLPKRGRKEITVDRTLYHYIVKDYVSIVIRNQDTGEIIKWHEEWKPKWKLQLKPSDVEKIIRDHYSAPDDQVLF